MDQNINALQEYLGKKPRTIQDVFTIKTITYKDIDKQVQHFIDDSIEEFKTKHKMMEIPSSIMMGSTKNEPMIQTINLCPCKTSEGDFMCILVLMGLCEEEK